MMRGLALMVVSSTLFWTLVVLLVGLIVHFPAGVVMLTALIVFLLTAFLCTMIYAIIRSGDRGGER